jgi:hypothetical protein
MSSLHRRHFLSLLGAGAATAALRPAQASTGLVVIVPAGAEVRELALGELAAIFTTRRRNLEGGTTLIPLNLPPRDRLRVAFDQAVLGMGPEEVARYWVDRRVRGGNAPPRHVPSASLVARLVARLPGAVGYVPESDLAPGVRVVARIS